MIADFKQWPPKCSDSNRNGEGASKRESKDEKRGVTFVLLTFVLLECHENASRIPLQKHIPFL